jgi:hypothetical protein
MKKNTRCRPIDTKHELEVVRRLHEYLGWDCKLAEPRAVYDILKFSFVEERVTDLIEVKYRNFRWGRHETVHLSEKKVMNCLNEADKLKCEFHFAVLCESGLYMARLTRGNIEHMPRKQGGRVDRGVMRDTETLIDIPVGMFYKL